jgi:DNA replication and repair protein RecF
MRLRRVSLSYFRCHHSFSCHIGPHITFVIGANAKGKTSLLEAVYMLSEGKGYREDEEIELLTWDMPHGYISGEYEHLTQHEAAVTYQVVDNRLQKRYLLNNAATTVTNYRRIQTPCVLFAPHQINIITGSPSHRREYINTVLENIDPLYHKAHHEYMQALRKRNKLLEEWVDRAVTLSQLVFWNEYMSERAAYIHAARSRYIAALNTKPDCAGAFFHAKYIPSIFDKAHLCARQETELAARRTLIGPQKDDIEITLSPKGNEVARKVSSYGSRSQQRLALLWLKLGEIELIQSHKKISPLLLLDDIFSEFDTSHHQIILDILPQFQTIIASTESDERLTALYPDATIVKWD